MIFSYNQDAETQKVFLRHSAQPFWRRTQNTWSKDLTTQDGPPSTHVRERKGMSPLIQQYLMERRLPQGLPSCWGSRELAFISQLCWLWSQVLLRNLQLPAKCSPPMYLEEFWRVSHECWPPQHPHCVTGLCCWPPGWRHRLNEACCCPRLLQARKSSPGGEGASSLCVTLC